MPSPGKLIARKATQTRVYRCGESNNDNFKTRPTAATNEKKKNPTRNESNAISKLPMILGTT